jgi:hypothetical protein
MEKNASSTFPWDLSKYSSQCKILTRSTHSFGIFKSLSHGQRQAAQLRQDTEVTVETCCGSMVDVVNLILMHPHLRRIGFQEISTIPTCNLSVSCWVYHIQYPDGLFLLRSLVSSWFYALLMVCMHHGLSPTMVPLSLAIYPMLSQ